jgi:hypothetical protein
MKLFLKLDDEWSLKAFLSLIIDNPHAIFDPSSIMIMEVYEDKTVLISLNDEPIYQGDVSSFITKLKEKGVIFNKNTKELCEE